MIRREPHTVVDFSDYILERTRNFTGREWAFSEIDRWLANPDGPRTFLVVGTPGSGKSTVAARLVQMSSGGAPSDEFPRLGPGQLTFYHFCQALRDSTLCPLRLIEALAQTLAARYKPFEDAVRVAVERSSHITINARPTQTVTAAQSGAKISAITIEVHIGNTSSRAAFDEIVRKPLEALYNGGFDEQMLIMVDSLDEARTWPGENILTLLDDVSDDFMDLPKPVRLLLTTRPDPRVLDKIGHPALDLINDAPDNIADVQAYAHNRLSQLSEPRRAKLAERVAAAGNGNFLYARYILDDLSVKVAQTIDISSIELPEGLEGIYRQFLNRELADQTEHWTDRYRPILGLLAIARDQGLTREVLAGATEMSLSQIDVIIRALAQFLNGSVPDGPFQIYHPSFREFLLTDSVFQIYPAETSQIIAEFLLDEYGGDWRSGTPYALQYVPSHLFEASQAAPSRRAKAKLVDRLLELLTDFQFLEAKAARVGIDALREDVHAAKALTSTVYRPSFALSTLAEVLDEEAVNLRQWDSAQRPVFFAQQLHNRAIQIGAVDLSEHAVYWLTGLGLPYLGLLWYGPSQVKSVFEGSLRNVVALRADRLMTPYGQWGFAIPGGLPPEQEYRFQGHFPGHFIQRDEKGEHAVGLLVQQSTPYGKVQISISDAAAESGEEPVIIQASIPKMEAGSQVIGVQIQHFFVQVGEDDFSQAWSSFITDLPVMLTADGRYVITARNDGTLAIWDVQTGRLEHILQGHTGPVSAIAVTPDGQWVISASVDRTLKVWDLEFGGLLHTLIGHARGVSAVAVTPDGHRVVSASADTTLKIWDLPTGKDINTLSGHTDSVYAVAITSDGRRVISASWDHTLKVWDLETGRELYNLEGHDDKVLSLTLTQDGQWVVSTSVDDTLRVWDVDRGRPMGFSKTNGVAHWVGTIPNSSHVISVSPGSTKAWDLATLQEVETINLPSILNVVSSSSGDRVFLTSPWSEILQAIDLRTGRVIAETALSGNLGHLVLGPNDTTVITSDEAGNLYCLRYVEPMASNLQADSHT